MKRETLEQWVLLRDSGELGALQSWRLKRALARDPELRAFEQSVSSLTRAVQSTSDVPPVPSYSMHQILRAAESALPPSEDRTKPAPVRWLLPLVSYSILILVAIGGLLALRLIVPGGISGPNVVKAPTPPAPITSEEALAWEDGFEEVMSALQTTLASADESWMNGSTTASTDEETIAEQLLSLENTEI